jgi:hypothetical protein
MTRAIGTRIRVAAVTALLAVPAHGCAGEPETAAVGIRTSDLDTHVKTLADEGMEGRRAGSESARLAEAYITNAFRNAGLAPGGDGGSYAQAFSFDVAVRLGPASFLRSGDRTFDLGRDWRPLPISKPGTVPPAGVVPAGYGIVVPAGDGFSARDDYGGAEVRGRWALVRGGLPEGLGPAEEQRLLRFATIEGKARAASEEGAVGILVVDGPGVEPGAGRDVLGVDPTLDLGGIAVVALSHASAPSLLAAGAPSGLEAAAKGQTGVGATPTLEARIDFEYEQRECANVVGVLRAEPRGAGLPLVVGAHYDHLGRGGIGSRAKPGEEGMVHPGADDNASGIAALIEIGRRLAEERRTRTFQPVRDVIFAAFSGEEISQRGSRAFVGNDTTRRFAAYLNMDMIGRLADTLVLSGTGTGEQWDALIERAKSRLADPPAHVSEAVPKSATDTMPFYCAGVPVLAADTRLHLEYHTPRDLPGGVRLDGVARIADLEMELIRELATSESEMAFAYVHSRRSSPCVWLMGSQP